MLFIDLLITLLAFKPDRHILDSWCINSGLYLIRAPTFTCRHTPQDSRRRRNSQLCGCLLSEHFPIFVLFGFMPQSSPTHRRRFLLLMLSTTF